MEVYGIDISTIEGCNKLNREHPDLKAYIDDEGAIYLQGVESNFKYLHQYGIKAKVDDEIILDNTLE